MPMYQFYYSAIRVPRVIYLGERELVLFCLQNSDRAEDIPYYYYGNYSNYETDDITGQYDYGSNGKLL